MKQQCPDCEAKAPYRVGSKNRPDRFRCRNCGREWTERNHRPRKQPRLLSIDIETLPLKYYAWSPYGDYLGRQLLIEDWSLLSYSAKWVGDDRIMSNVLTPEEAVKRDDRRIAAEIWQLLDKSHIWITHNGRRFDIRKINTRFWKHQLHKPSQGKLIDTLVTAKSVFGLTYNTMDFIAEFIERDEKLHTNMDLWARADRGDPAALDEMLAYNEQDVRTQEQIYMRMREWIPNHPNLTIYNHHDKNACPVCLHKEQKQIGFFYTNKKRYPEFRCKGCGTTWHGSKAV